MNMQASLKMCQSEGTHSMHIHWTSSPVHAPGSVGLRIWVMDWMVYRAALYKNIVRRQWVNHNIYHIVLYILLWTCRQYNSKLSKWRYGLFTEHKWQKYRLRITFKTNLHVNNRWIANVDWCVCRWKNSNIKSANTALD